MSNKPKTKQDTITKFHLDHNGDTREFSVKVEGDFVGLLFLLVTSMQRQKEIEKVIRAAVEYLDHEKETK